ncbi:MAG: serine/threonine-protein kinase [Polyangiaceae bacterium]
MSTHRPPPRFASNPAVAAPHQKSYRKSTHRGQALLGPRSRIGRVELGSFRILELLGQGSFGEAYLTEQLHTDRRAVLKIAHGQLVRGPAAANVRRRFAAEVRAATRVSHPNLVTIFTSGETSDGLPAIAMEFIDGETLDTLLQREAPLSGHQLAIFQQLASALNTIHEHGILHRDVAPRNVMVTTDHYGERRAILLDFGMAAITGRAASMAPVGTPLFVAPEQLQLRSEKASDIYSLGALLWWALCGSPMRTDEQSRPIDPPRSLNPAISEELEELLLSLVHPRPARRPTAQAFMEVWPHFAAAFDDRVTQTSLEPPPSSSLAQSHLLVLEPNVVSQRLITKVGERAGMTVKVMEHMELDYDRHRFDAIVVSARCSDPEIRMLLRFAKERAPGAHLILATHGPETAWSSKFDTEVAVPGEMRFLEEVLASLVSHRSMVHSAPAHDSYDVSPVSVEAHSIDVFSSYPPQSEPPSSRSVSLVTPQARDQFVGMMPVLLSELMDAASGHDLIRMQGLCDQVVDLSHQVGARPLERIATMYRELIAENAAGDLEALIEELENAYAEAFRQLGPQENYA